MPPEHNPAEDVEPYSEFTSDPDQPTAATLHDWTKQEAQDIQPGPTPSPREQPPDCKDITNLSTEERNRVLQETLAYYHKRKVKTPSGKIGTVVGVDPRPMKGVPTSSGPDGNYLCVVFTAPLEKVYHLPSELILVNAIEGKEIKT